MSTPAIHFRAKLALTLAVWKMAWSVKTMNEKNNLELVIISLDQNAISFLERRQEAGQPWPKIKSLLIAGVDAGRIICPTPHETVWESTSLPKNPYRRVKELQSQLSCGVSFKSFSRLLAEETLAVVRAGVDITPWEPGN